MILLAISVSVFEEEERDRAPLASPSTLHQVKKRIASWAIPIISLSMKVSLHLDKMRC